MLHNKQCPDVIIVGAGIAGLEAARTLRASGHSVLILERNKQPGGRAIVGSIGDKNTPIDYGGAWIHGGRTNPLTLEVDAMGFNRQRTAFDFPYFRNSHKATKEEMQRFDTAAEQFEEAVSTAAHSVELERKLSEDACDKYKNGVLPNQIYDDLKSKLSSSKVSRIDNLRNLPVGSSDKFCALAKEDLRLTSDVAEHYTPSKEFDEDIIALLTANSGPLESAVELNKTSVVDTEYFEAGDHSGGDWLVDKGMGSFVKKLGEAVPQEVFRFNSTVTEIDYSERGVKVTTAADSYEGSYALVTVSVGVLQRRTIRFKPDLPLDKREAIDNVQMGNMQKVIVPFNMDIFPNIVSNSWVLYEGDLPPEVLPFAKEHHLPLVGKKRAVMAFVIKPLNQNIAIGFFGGDWAKALEEECSTASGMQSGESKPCDDLSLKITKLALHNISGKTSTDVEIAIQGKIHVTHWSLDPTSFGAYSAATPGVWYQREILAEPVKDQMGANRLFFAGEGTAEPKYNGSYAGAYLSGHRAAEEIDTAIRCGGLAHRLQSIFFRDCDPVGRIVWDIVTLMAFVAIVIATSLIAMEIFSYKTDPPFIVRFTPTALRTATVIAIVAAIVSSILVRNKVELVGLTILIGGAIYALMVHENLMSGER